MTYQQEAKQKVRVFLEEEALYSPTKEEDGQNLDTATAQTITDLIDELQEVMGGEVEMVGDEVKDNPEKERVNRESAGYNTLHRKLTKKFNQIRE